MLRTAFCTLAGIEVPIVQAPIAASPALAAAVAAAGALGQLSLSWTDPAAIGPLLRETATLTDRPVGVNLVLEWPQQGRLAAALEAGARIVSTFWGDPAPYAGQIRAAGALWLHAAGSVAEAEEALAAGVDVLVAQGWEAGGHVRSEVATLALVPRIVDLAGTVPVIAAGGIADGRGLAAVLCLGAAGAWVGTRFLAALEMPAHDRYRAAVLAADVGDTARPAPFSVSWDGDHRVVRTPLVRAWEEAGRPAAGARVGEGEVVAHAGDGRPIVRYHYASPRDDMTGAIEELALYAGQSAGLVHRLQPAGDIVRELVAEAEDVLERRGRRP